MRDLATIAELNGIEILGILDHHYWGQQDSIANIPVIGDERWLLDPEHKLATSWRQDCVFFPGNWDIGQQNGFLQKLRLERINLLDQAQVEVINLIHPSASIPLTNSRYSDYKLGRGVLIHANVFHSGTEVVIGDYCSFLCGTIISENSTIERNVTVCPAVFVSHSHIKENTVMGWYSRTNHTFQRRDLVIGKNVSVWTSAEIVKDIPDNCMYTHDGRILTKGGSK